MFLLFFDQPPLFNKPRADLVETVYYGYGMVKLWEISVLDDADTEEKGKEKARVAEELRQLMLHRWGQLYDQLSVLKENQLKSNSEKVFVDQTKQSLQFLGGIIEIHETQSEEINEIYEIIDRNSLSSK